MNENARSLRFARLLRAKETHTERERARRIRKPHHHLRGFRRQKTNTTHVQKKKSASRAQGPLTFLIFHISMFSSWSSPMDAILFSSLSSLFVLRVRARNERSDVVFFEQQREPPADLLKKKMKKRNFWDQTDAQTKKLEREREKKSAQIPKKSSAFFVAARQRGVPFLISTLSKFLLSVSLS